MASLEPEPVMNPTLISSTFHNGDEIPKRYACQGVDVSRPLEWYCVPCNAKSLALIVDDPDARDPAAPCMRPASQSHEFWSKICPAAQA
jgi:phosphatidylethanolamine-binding protein (PEBP) family uncharacterized protein